MSFKTVLAIVGVKDTIPDIDRAIAIAADRNAHLTILVLGVAIPPLPADYPVVTAWIEERQREIDLLAKVRQQVEVRCSRDRLSFEIDHFYDGRFMLESDIGLRAMYADVVMMGSSVRNEPELRKAATAATAFDARCPLLLIPADGVATLRPKNVMIAWNSRPEAASAVKAALGLLRDADTVHITIVDPDTRYLRNGGEPGADMAAFLSRHDVYVVVEQLASGGRRIEEVLRQHAFELGCDLIVMGAYGHSRLRQRIFGGVTASVLEDCKIPVFMSR